MYVLFLSLLITLPSHIPRLIRLLPFLIFPHAYLITLSHSLFYSHTESFLSFWTSISQSMHHEISSPPCHASSPSLRQSIQSIHTQFPSSFPPSLSLPHCLLLFPSLPFLLSPSNNLQRTYAAVYDTTSYIAVYISLNYCCCCGYVGGNIVGLDSIDLLKQ